MVEIDEVVDRLVRANAEHTPVLAARDVLEELVRKQSTLGSAFGLPERGGITPLHQTPELTVLHVAWTPGMRLYPHEHKMWAAIGLYGGQEDNAFYRRTPEGLQPSGGTALTEGNVLLMGDDAIHSVSNPRRDFAVALHVYGGDFFAADGRSEWDPETLAERPRDMQRTARLFEDANFRWARENER
jgi:predicted metal-dependent enzyme (double-stranded beta helix superfamily)